MPKKLTCVPILQDSFVTKVFGMSHTKNQFRTGEQAKSESDFEQEKRPGDTRKTIPNFCSNESVS